MKTNRNGKIARLPKTLREELNTRLDNNESGPKLLAWLNTHPDVLKILAEQFAGRPISQQNLSEWRRRGYQDWLELQEKRQRALQVFEQAEAFETDAGAKKLSAAFATLAVADFVETARAKLQKCTDLDQRWALHGEIQERLSRLRRDDYRAGNLKLRQDRWDYKLADDQRAAGQATENEERRQELAFFKLRPNIRELAQQWGGDEQSHDLASYILELEHKLEQGFLGRFCPIPSEEPETPTPTPSDSPAPSTHPSHASHNSQPLATTNAPTPDSRITHHASPPDPTPTNPPIQQSTNRSHAPANNSRPVHRSLGEGGSPQHAVPSPHSNHRCRRSSTTCDAAPKTNENKVEQSEIN